MADDLSEGETSNSVLYRTLVTDPSLLAVFLISWSIVMGTAAVPVSLPSIGNTLELTETQVGLIMSVFYLPGVLLIPVTGVLADIYGRRRVVLPSLALLGVSGLATLFVHSYPTLLLLRGLQGIAFAGSMPLTPTLIGDLYTGAQGAAAQGIRSGLNGLSNTIAPVLAGLLAVIAWQYPFILFAPILVGVLIAFYYYPEPVEVDTEGQDSIRAVIEEFLTYWRAIRVEATDRTLALLFGGGFALFFVKQGVRTFVPVFIVQELHAPITIVGTIFGVYGATRVLVSPLAGLIEAKIGRKVTMIGVAILVAVSVGTLPFIPSVYGLGLAVIGFGAGEAILNPVLNAAVADFTVTERRGGIMSALVTLKQIALTVSPMILGAIIVISGFTGAFLLAAFIALVFGVSLMFFVESVPTTTQS